MPRGNRSRPPRPFPSTRRQSKFWPKPSARRNQFMTARPSERSPQAYRPSGYRCRRSLHRDHADSKPFLIDSVRELAGAILPPRSNRAAPGWITTLRCCGPVEASLGSSGARRAFPAAMVDTARRQHARPRHGADTKAMASRLDELGIDFAVMYPSRMLTADRDPRSGTAPRDLPQPEPVLAEAYKPYADRMTPVGADPDPHAGRGNRRAGLCCGRPGLSRRHDQWLCIAR